MDPNLTHLPNGKTDLNRRDCDEIWIILSPVFLRRNGKTDLNRRDCDATVEVPEGKNSLRMEKPT